MYVVLLKAKVNNNPGLTLVKGKRGGRTFFAKVFLSLRSGEFAAKIRYLNIYA